MKQIATSSIHDVNLEEGYPGKIIITKLHPVMADASLKSML